MSKKQKNSKPGSRSIIRFICGLAAVACLGYFAVYVYMSDDSSSNFEDLSKLKDNKKVTVQAKPVVHLDAPEDAPPVLEEFNTLLLKNKNIIGWIQIEDTKIDYPVMQSKDEEYYLDHNIDQEKDNNGAIFIDAECSIWPRSQNIIIYGHNMKSGKMFGSLDGYKNKDFYDKHPVIRFDTLYDKGKYRVMYVFNDVVHEETEVAFKYYQFIDANSAQEYASNMNEMKEKSLYDTGVESYYGDSLITLSTCDYSEGSERFVVVAKKVE